MLQRLPWPVREQRLVLRFPAFARLLETALQERGGGSCSGVHCGKGGTGRGCEIDLQCSNVFLHLLQESFSLGSHGINSDRSSSVDDEGLKNLIAVRQCLVRK
jgi:hypothetical protein